MGRGFLAGILWGGLIGLVLLVVSNEVLDRRELSFPQPDAAPVEVPAGTEFDQARPETDPVVPEAETRPGAEGVAGVQAPDELGETPPSFDTSSLEVPTPSLDGPGTLGDAPQEATGPELGGSATDDNSATESGSPALTTLEAPTQAPETTTAAPTASDAPSVAETSDVTAPDAETSPEVAGAGETGEPSAEAPEQAPAVADSGAAPSSPTVAPESGPAPTVANDTSGVTLPESGDVDVAAVAPEDNTSLFTRPVELQVEPAPSIPESRLPGLSVEQAAPEPTPEAEPEPEPQPEPETETATAEPESPSTLPTVRRLGQEATDAAEAADDEMEQETAETPEAVEPSGRALSDWRIPFDNPGDKPLVSIVLVHDGSSDIADILRATPETVAIGVDAGAANARDIAAAYRSAGREVVLIPSLPTGAAPQDVEVTLQSNFETISQAVAVMDASGEGFQADREAVAQVVDAIAETGHGLITFPRGLNTALQQAERSGVPAGLVFRDIDGTGQDTEQVQRALDRAAFRARQDEAVILVGRTTGDTLVALTEWVLGSRAETVTLAPVSVALEDG